ncbi:MAG: DNA-binding protein [Nocardia sp.]|nr:DNA-binding protein [Nocardia sp.]
MVVGSGCDASVAARPTTVVDVSAIPYSDDVLPDSVTLLALPDVAELMGLAVTRVHALLREHQLIAVRRNGVIGIPKEFFDSTGEIAKHVSPLITVMRDSRYTNEEILEWIYTEDDSLPGRPIDALHGDLAREVIRRAAADPF